jgi:hypothetical protein
LRGQAGREGHRMLLGDADVEGALGMRLGELVDPVPDGIAAVIATIVGSLSASLASVSPKNVLIGRRTRLGLGLHARDDVELLDAVIFVAPPRQGRSPCLSW